MDKVARELRESCAFLFPSSGKRSRRQAAGELIQPSEASQGRAAPLNRPAKAVQTPNQ
jgi:hypothetical protein